MFDVEKIRGGVPDLHASLRQAAGLYLDSGPRPETVTGDRDDRYLNRSSTPISTAGCITFRRRPRESTKRRASASLRFRAAEKEEVFSRPARRLRSIRWPTRGATPFVGRGQHRRQRNGAPLQIVPWQMLCERKGPRSGAAVRRRGRLRTELLPSLRRTAYRAVAVTQASNTLGTRPELRGMIERAHAVGAIAVVDGCQACARAADMQAMDCDSTHSRDITLRADGNRRAVRQSALLEWMPPFMGVGTWSDTVTFAKTTYAPCRSKFEAERPIFRGAIGSAKRVKFVQRFDPRRGRSGQRSAAAPCDGTSRGIDGTADLRHGARQMRHRVVQRRGRASLRYGDDSRQARHRRPYRTALRRAGDGPLRTTGMCRASFALYNTLAEPMRWPPGSNGP